MSRRDALVRDVDAGHVAVDFVELFFDLVYVFAITQLSHFLIAHLSWLGLVQTLVLFLAVWWAWVYTTWATNWLDPGRVVVRLMIFGVMLASLAMSASLPDAFGSRGTSFALAYVAIQVGRTLFLTWVMWRARPRLGLTLLRVRPGSSPARLSGSPAPCSIPRPACGSGRWRSRSNIPGRRSNSPCPTSARRGAPTMPFPARIWPNAARC